MLTLCPLSLSGAVVKGVKPAELVKLEEKCLICFKLLSLRLSIFQLARGFYLVYDKDSLEKSLASPCVKEILQNIGYTLELHIDLATLKERFVSGYFPEIGFYVGYPTKDVLGFMGYDGFIYSHTKGWKVYYPSEPSTRLYNIYKQAKDEFSNGSYQCYRKQDNSLIELDLG